MALEGSSELRFRLVLVQLVTPSVPDLPKTIPLIRLKATRGGADKSPHLGTKALSSYILQMLGERFSGKCEPFDVSRECFSVLTKAICCSTCCTQTESRIVEESLLQAEMSTIRHLPRLTQSIACSGVYHSTNASNQRGHSNDGAQGVTVAPPLREECSW